MALVNITAIPRPTLDWQFGNRLADGSHPQVGATGRKGFQPIESHGLSQAFIDRFSVFFTESPEGCWLWSAGVDAYGYGQIARDYRKGPIKAHRAMWMLVHGPITSAEHVLHKCDTPRCVNPDHLFLGDQAVNMKDAALKGRLSRRPRPRARRLSDADEHVLLAIYRAHSGRLPKGMRRKLSRRFGVSESYVSILGRGHRVRATKGAA